jgi:hypothetical protein
MDLYGAVKTYFLWVYEGLFKKVSRSFVLSFVLVWSGRDLGGLSMLENHRKTISVFGLVWFSIRGSCQSLSLIENHI